LGFGEVVIAVPQRLSCGIGDQLENQTGAATISRLVLTS